MKKIIRILKIGLGVICLPLLVAGLLTIALGHLLTVAAYLIAGSTTRAKWEMDEVLDMFS